MPRIDPKQPVLASVLDRLIDEQPDESWEDSPGGAINVERLRKAVRRDIEKLLNTRRRAFDRPVTKTVRESVLGYGVPDWSGRNLSSRKKREQFVVDVIKSVIDRYEHRVRKSTVTLIESSDSYDRMLHFRIEADLFAEPSNLTLWTDVDPLARVVEVKL